MEQWKVRPAGAEDMQKVLHLIEQLAIYEKEPDAVQVKLQGLINWGFSDPPFFWAWVVDTGFEIPAFLLAYRRFSTWRGPVLYVEDVFVLPDFRGRGMALELFRAAAAFARNQHLPFLQWQVLDWNKPAIVFYEKMGAASDPSWINMSIPTQKLLP